MKAVHAVAWLEQKHLISTWTESFRPQARSNTMDQFKLAFDPKGMQAVLSRMERNETISSQVMSNEQLRALALELMMQQVYQHFQEG